MSSHGGDYFSIHTMYYVASSQKYTGGMHTNI